MKLSVILIFLVGLLSLETNAKKGEVFIIEKRIEHLPVINQGSTGTCWSFATTSFLESEIIRKGLPAIDLSEMFFVNYAYKNKAEQYLLYHGNNNFSEGGLAHDVLNIVKEEGMSTFEDFPGIQDDGSYRHYNLVNSLNVQVTELNKKSDDFDASDLETLDPILKQYIGKLPKKIKVGSDKITPAELPEKLNINTDDYVNLSSFTHHPFYQPFVLEVPDNWAHGLFYNLPIDELIEVMDYSLDNGYSLCWDGDTSEKTFSHEKGKAYLPEDQTGKVDQDLRQEAFYQRKTTDDHLMHVVGVSKDSEGRRCYYIKNSWGAESNDYGGYLNMTVDYARLKTIAILVHKDAIPPVIRKKLNL